MVAPPPVDAFKGKLRVEKTDGSFFEVRGKLASVAYMLAKRPRGVTGWDCLPWLLRLDRRIDRLRDRYGVSILTEMQAHSDGKHARYILAERLKVSWV